MIVPMIKYSFVMHSRDHKEFVERLQGLGLVDVSSRGWQPTETEQDLLRVIDKIEHSLKELRIVAAGSDISDVAACDDGRRIFDEYIYASAELAKIKTAMSKLAKEIEDTSVLGDFSVDKLRELREEGVVVRVFMTFTKDFDRNIHKWDKRYAIEEIARRGDVVWFFTVNRADSPPVAIDAVEVKIPDSTASDKKEVLDGLLEEKKEFELTIRRCASGLETLEAYALSLKDELHLSKASTSSKREADGMLAIIEGWAAEETQEKVDRLLDENPVIYIKEVPKEEEDTPVLLKNNRFTSVFEFITRLYSLPKYGTIDLTPYFAPFYMMFFGMCLGDAGYGLIFVIGALVAKRKVKPSLRSILDLVIACGSSAIFFGLLGGNMFGIELGKFRVFEPVRDYLLTPERLFPLSLIIGIVHILFAMSLKVVLLTKMKGFRYSLSTIGWMIVVVSGLAAYFLPEAGVTAYAMGSIPFWCVTGAGLFLMLFCNSPGKNPFVNFGAGLWNTYNDVTGLLGDVLSYIRLFALGLCGGILALVFNNLAIGMSPDIIILKQVVIVLVLAVGQGFNIFMSALSSFVHPLRLTFLEFYKNAGFEAGGRAFDPLKKH